MRYAPARMLTAQLVAALVLAVAASVTLLVTPREVQLLVTRLVVGLSIGGLVTVEACTSGGPLRRGLTIGAIAVVLAVGVATLKRLLT